MTAKELCVLALFQEQVVLSSADIVKQTKMLSGTIYPILIQLEKSGVLESEWAPGPYPRKRLYRLKSDALPEGDQG